MRSVVRRGRCSLAILRWRHGRQLLNEANDRPNAVVFVGRAEGRHAGHSNAVFDDPERYGEASWRAHHETWLQSEFNQREYCEAYGVPLGNWRAKFKAEPQTPARKVLYRRG